MTFRIRYVLEAGVAESGTPDRSLRVLMVTRKWPPTIGGMETYSYKLAEALRERVELNVKALPGNADGSTPSIWRLTWFVCKTAFHLLRHAGRYDIVHFTDPVLLPLAWCVRLRGKASCFVTVHGLDMIYHRRRTMAGRLYALFMRLAVRIRKSVCCVIANSHHTASLAEEAGFGPVQVVPLGASIPEVRHTSERSGAPYVLFVGRLVPRKGLSWFIRNVLPDLPEDVRLKVVGTPWEKRELEAVRESPRADWVGPVSNDRLNTLLAGATATIMPNVPTLAGTDVEGFGLVALEAGVAGSVPVVASLEGLKDAVREGENGFQVEAENPALWRDTLLRILSWSDEQRRDFREKMRDTIAEHFTWCIVADRTVALYQQARSSNAKAQGPVEQSAKGART